MIVFVSESIASKKGMGSSLSGGDMLNFLRIKYSNILVLTYDSFFNTENTYYGYKLNPISEIVLMKRPIKSNYSFIKKIYYKYINIGKKSTIDIFNYFESNCPNIIISNSWSEIYQSGNLISIDKFFKVMYSHGNPESFYWQSKEINRNNAITKAAFHLNQFDAIIQVSEIGLKSWLKYLNKNITSFYLPNSIDDFEVNKILNFNKQSLIKYCDYNSNEFNIVVLGSIQLRKCQDILIKCFPDILNDIPNIKFHIIGPISKEWGGKEIMNNFNLSAYKKYFKFYGYREDGLMFLAAADLLVFTSRAEAFPRTVAEAMALKIPIIASNVSGVPEMIKHLSNGFLYESEDHLSLSKYIIEMYNNKSLATSFSINAFNDYRYKFSKNAHIYTALNLFTELEKIIKNK